MMKVLLISAIKFPYGSASINRKLTYGKGFLLNNILCEMVFFISSAANTYDFNRIGTYNGVPYQFLHRKITEKTTKISRLINLYTGFFRLFFFLYSEKQAHSDLSIILFSTSPLHYKTIGYYTKLLKIKYILEVCEYPAEAIKMTSSELETSELGIEKNYKLFDGIIFETNKLKNYYSRYLRADQKSVVVLTTMLYEDIEQANYTSDEFIIAYCGSVHSEKKDGIKNILTSIYVVKKSFPDFVFYIVGRIANQSYYQELIDTIKELNLSECVRFTGEIEREDYIKYLKMSKILVVAKEENSFFSGGLSSKVVEYLFAKKPVVLTKTDEFAEYLEKDRDAVFSESNAPEDLASSILSLVDNPQKAEQISESGYLRAREFFDYKKSIHTLIDFINNIKN